MASPQNPGPGWAILQVQPRQRLPVASQSARLVAAVLSGWIDRAAGASLRLHRALAAFAGICRPARSAVPRRLRSIAFRRPVPPSNPLLDEMAQSWRGLFVRMLAYVSGLAMLSLLAAELFQSAPVVAAVEPAPRPDWITVSRPHPAFHLSLPEISEEPRYAIRRHAAGGGRKDILSWGEPETSPRHFMLEIYRPGGELDGFGGPVSEIEMRTEGLATTDMHESLPIATKFGPVAMVDFNFDADRAGHCVGFVRTFDEPRLQMSGLFCNRDALVDRASLACALDRLTLISAGSDPDVAKLFAQAELKRNFCGQRDPILYATPRRSIAPVKPLTAELRGRLAR